MGIAAKKNQRWVAGLHEGIDQLDQDLKNKIMKPAGNNCALDLLALCEKYLEKRIESIEGLVSGWNVLREKRNLKGKWEFEGKNIRGIFGECGCPLVQSGLIRLHPVHCYCSQQMMENIFSRMTKEKVEVAIKRSICRGDNACEFLVRL
jgi:hypothetical protein